MSYEYTLTINNHSSHPDYFMLFQTDPGTFDPNAKAIAWFSKYSNPGENVTVKFTWTIDWGFSWADTGILSQGVKYEASETATASPSTNLITLDYNGAFTFSAQVPGPDPSRFYIQESANIPVNSSGAVGMTMSGSTVYATQARPNSNLTFSPHPSYAVAYGNYKPGEVIDVSTINNPLTLNYETGIYSLTATLNADDSWSMPQTLKDVNRAVLALKQNNPDASLSDVA